MTLSQTYISRKQLLVDNLVAKGVTGYTANDGLTTLINAVLEIQGGGVRTLTLTSDKDILSYADSESATLTATLLEDGVGVSGATVEFFNGSTSLGTAQTDSNGVATKTYTSTGAGDVSLKAEADNGILVSEICSVEDCTYYHESAFTTTQSSFNVPLPSSFELTFYTRRTSSSGNSSYLEIGGDTGNTALCGQIGSSGESITRIYNSEGSSTFTDHRSTNTVSNTLTKHTWIKQDNSNSYVTTGTPITWTDNITHNKIRKLNITNNRIEQLKVKPL